MPLDSAPSIARKQPPPGMRHWQPPITAVRTVDAASSRLFGEAYREITSDAHRGEILRFMLRALYGANYRKRGAAMLGVSLAALSEMLLRGRRVSRRRIDRLESALADRARHRRGELRELAASVEIGFAVEQAALARCVDELMARLARAASVAANTRQPHSTETGRFVRRVQGKAADLRERQTTGKKRGG